MDGRVPTRSENAEAPVQGVVVLFVQQLEDVEHVCGGFVCASEEHQWFVALVVQTCKEGFLMVERLELRNKMKNSWTTVRKKKKARKKGEKKYRKEKKVDASKEEEARKAQLPDTHFLPFLSWISQKSPIHRHPPQVQDTIAGSH